MDKLRDFCGVFGIFSKPDSITDTAYITYRGLFALQHRGQECAGIAVNDSGIISSCRDVGLVGEVISEAIIKKLTGHAAIGHVLYSVHGKPSQQDAQPLVFRHGKGNMALAFNGCITNAKKLRAELCEKGAIFQSKNHTEVIAYLIAQERLSCGSIEEAVKNAMGRLEGAYSLLILSPTKLIAARDKNGFRPLCMGELNGDLLFSSESCAIDAVGGDFVRDIAPGEIVCVNKDGIKSDSAYDGRRTSQCIFELIYFARPDSVLDGVSISMARHAAGRRLATEHPADADIVIGVPDSGIEAAVGYARQSGIPYGIGLIKNRYVGRTFISRTQGRREQAIKLKLNPLRKNIEGKKVVLVDDSIVRGTTCKRIVSLLRDAGAKEVHMRISSPPFLNPCYYGTDIPSREILIAHTLTVEEIREEIGADSLGYLSAEGLSDVAAGSSLGLCDGCFTGNYPTAGGENEK